MQAPHTLTITGTGFGRDPAEPEFTITCPGVTDACAEWVECPNGDCPGWGARDDEFEVGNLAHGEEHSNLDGTWMIRSGGCYAETHGHAEAAEFAERNHLSAGQYHVRPQFDDGMIVDFELVDSEGTPAQNATTAAADLG